MTKTVYSRYRNKTGRFFAAFLLLLALQLTGFGPVWAEAENLIVKGLPWWLRW